MKKFLLMILFLSLAGTDSSAITLTVTSGGTLSYTDTSVTDDAGDTVTTHTVSSYEFSTILDALTFANDPEGYLEALNDDENIYVLPDSDSGNFGSIIIALNMGDSGTTSSVLGGEIKFSDYGAITNVSINPGGSLRTLNTDTDRHFIIDSGTNVSFDNLALHGNGSSGGVEISNTGKASFNNVTFSDINFSGNGGGVSVNGGTADFTGTTSFTSNDAANGGALYITGNSTVTLNSGITFTSNTADNNGGAVYTASTSAVTFTSPAFDGNEAANGGALYVNGPVNISGSTFTNNSATNGGGVYVTNGNSLTFTDTNTFTGNSATTNGGAIYSAGTLDLSGTNTFTNDTAGNQGGAIYCTGNNLTVSAVTTFESCHASTGGAVAVNSTSAAFSDVTFNNNSADNGGAVAVLGGTADFSGSSNFASSSADKGGSFYITGGTANINSGVTFTGSKANNGGVIYILNSGTANIRAAVSGGEATENGGAIYLAGGTANIAGDLTGSSAQNGGAVYIENGTACVSCDSGVTVGISSNNAASFGGAVCLSGDNATLKTTGSGTAAFTSNSAVNGGAVYLHNGAFEFGAQETNFTRNSASENGGAWWLSLANLPDGEITFTSNSALGSGGAIYVADTSRSQITLPNSYTFISNSAESYGGAIFTLSADIIIDNLIISTPNTAGIGGGFACSETGSITIQNNSEIYYQKAAAGGAIYAQSVTVSESTFGENETEGGTGNLGGGAIYVNGDSLSIEDSIFDSNKVNQGNAKGGAICVNGSNSDVSLSNSLFIANSTASDNGGAMAMEKITGSSFSYCTFRDNQGNNGGAIYTDGERLTIASCYFYNNYARSDAGSVYFAQADVDRAPVFVMRKSMFTANYADGERGGALYIYTNTSTIDSCTFNENYINGTAMGGALYLQTLTESESSSTIDNCTFYHNRIEYGDENSSYGGGLYLACARARMRSCAFTLNAAPGKGGGAFYLESGILSIIATLAVGNIVTGRYDIRLAEGNPEIRSNGYNRVGKFGIETGEVDFKARTGNNESDRTSWQNKNWMTVKESYYNGNELAVNAPSGYSDVPPSIGTTLGDSSNRPRLLTLMLNEADSLPLDDRATSIIPFYRRNSLPALDERGFPRAWGGATPVMFDVGPVVFGGQITSHDIYPNTIKYIQMSGVPNEIRRVGQTASLVAKVTYTNGRTAYGGTGDDDEHVTWSSDPSDYYVHVDPDTGDLTSLRVTASPESDTYVTITVSTVRLDDDGNPYTDSKRIKITNGEFSYLNTSPNYPGRYLNDLIDEFIEYNIGFGLTDVSTVSVDSSSFQANFASIWGSSATQVNDLTTNEPVITLSNIYPASNGYTASKGAGVTIDFRGRNKGDIFPVTYTWNFTGEELESIISYDLSASALDDASLCEELFKSLLIEFQGVEGKWPVIGQGGVNAREAFESGALVLNNFDGNKGVQIELTAYIANVEITSGSQLVASSESDLLVVPDGVPTDGRIYGTMWLAQDMSTSSSTTSTVKAQGTVTADNESKNGGSNGGGGCNASLFGGLIILSCLALMKRR